MKNIINLLTANTQNLRTQYIEQTREWSAKRFAWAQNVTKWDAIKWCEFFGLTPAPRKDYKGEVYMSFPEDFHNTRKAREKRTMSENANKIVKIGLDLYIENNVKAAEDHYVESLEKLAYRLVQKGVSDDRAHEIEVIDGSVGVNFHITLKLDAVVVRAWTIIASGPIQRPHYRYLVK